MGVPEWVAVVALQTAVVKDATGMLNAITEMTYRVCIVFSSSLGRIIPPLFPLFFFPSLLRVQVFFPDRNM